MKHKTLESVEITQVTPAMASRWVTLVANDQRNLSAVTVDHYARQMREGRFRLSNDAIIFDTRGRLINGQHRLNAVLTTNTTQPFIVGRNFDPASFIIMDRQNTRRTQQFIKAKRRSALAGAAYHVVLYERGEFPKPQAVKVEPSEALEALQANPEIAESVDVIHVSTAHRLGKIGFMSFLHWFYVNRAGQDRITVDSFFYGAASGEGLTKGDPALTFRNRITLGSHVDTKTWQAMAIKAIKAHLRGDRLNVLKWASSEAFPALEL